MRLRVQLFGPFQLWRDDEPIPLEAWRGYKAQAFFKILLTEPGRPFTHDQLIDWLWPDTDLDKADKHLRSLVSRVRHILEPELKRGTQSQYILTRPSGYRFNPQADCVIDSQRFEGHLRQARQLESNAQFEPAIREYEQALALYQGEFLADDRYEDWAIPHIERWQRTYLDALSQLAECHARLGQYRRAIEYCQRVIELDPYHEENCRQKMRYHAHAGERREALRVYETYAKTLRDELDMEPAPETRELYLQIRNGEIPVLEPPRAVPNNLPIALTRFIGREKELDTVQKLLLDEDVRLLTLTGVGGTGKTRLGLKVATDLLDHFEDGAYFVDLSPLRDPELMVSTIAQTLRIKEFGDRPLINILKGFLREKQMLLLLDNFEPVVEAAPQVVELVATCPQLKVLVASREVLHVSGEHVFLVLPLMQSEAVQLFIERTRAVKPDVAGTDENASAIVEICIRLGGARQPAGGAGAL
ncbi:MAG: BTAD domain-containing putative transcriptional regulator [Candidatus Bipolaricaulia bacterium]